MEKMGYTHSNWKFIGFDGFRILPARIVGNSPTQMWIFLAKMRGDLAGFSGQKAEF